jgi:hypothetical protein
MMNSDYTDPGLAYAAIINRKELTTSDASKNLIPLYEALPYMTSDDIEKARVAYENNVWKRSVQEFINKYRSVLTMLKDVV